MLQLDEVLEAAEMDGNIGFCIACGEQAFDVEPDARKYECESCGEHKVYGAEELLLSWGLPIGSGEIFAG